MWTVLEGQMVGMRYEIRRHIATGGMAAVFQGWDHRLNRPVAIKVLRRLDDATTTDVGRFRREAHAAAALDCQQVVKVYDFVEEQGCAYLVLEYVDGGTLKEAIAKRGPLPPVEALAIAAEICRGLQCAHERGFIHRDVKPQNVLLANDGEVKLTDFGIVRLGEGADFTSSGMVLGTADYISPEQAQGLALTPATDIYSLGVALFEMLTGALPFDGTTVIAVAMAHATKPVPSVRQLNPEVPPRVERLVRRALAKQPDRRFRSAAEMELALRHALADLADEAARGALVAAAAPAARGDGDPTLPKPGRAGAFAERLSQAVYGDDSSSRRITGDTWSDESLPSAVVEAYLPAPESLSAHARLLVAFVVALLLVAGIALVSRML